MHFTDAHSSSAVCTPTRYSILTGRYHWRTHLQKGVLGGFSRPLIDANRVTAASFLRDQGYETACIGKWHLGMDWPRKGGGAIDDGGNFAQDYADAWKVDYAAPIQNGRLDRGFDHYFGISASLDMPPFVYIRDRLVTEQPTVDKTWIRKGPAGASFEAVEVLPRLGQPKPSSSSAEGPNRKPKTNLSFSTSRSTRRTREPSRRPNGRAGAGINDYADFVMQVDHCTGEILKALDTNGLTANTLLILTSDNGCSPQAQDG